MAILRNKLQTVQIWMRRRQLSAPLCSKIRTYYAEVWVDHQGEPVLVSAFSSAQRLLLSKQSFVRASTQMHMPCAPRSAAAMRRSGWITRVRFCARQAA